MSVREKDFDIECFIINNREKWPFVGIYEI